MPQGSLAREDCLIAWRVFLKHTEVDRGGYRKWTNKSQKVSSRTTTDSGDEFVFIAVLISQNCVFPPITLFYYQITPIDSGRNAAAVFSVCVHDAMKRPNHSSLIIESMLPRNDRLQQR